MNEPGAGELAQFWTLYGFGEDVAVHEQLWPESEFGPLYPDAIYEALGTYEAAFETESGERMPASEWRLPLSDFRDWLRA